MRMYRLLYLFTAILTGFMVCSLAACKKNKPEEVIAYTPSPYITSFTPSAPEGGTVVILGGNFSSDKTKNSVTLNSLAVEVTHVNPEGTELTILVPVGATSGKFTVTVNGKTAMSSTNFIVDPGAPGITAITPDFGAAGTSFEITGTNFKPGAKVIFEGDKEATNVVVISKTKITAQAPTGAKSGKIRVQIGALSALSPVDFDFPPTISSVSATYGLPGATIVEINGANFTPATKIYFGTAEATPSYRNDHFIKLTVPAGATTGKIKLVSHTMEVESNNIFTIMQPLSITSITPGHGASGTLLTIKGSHFQPGAQVLFEMGSILVTIIAATDVTVVSGSELTARVPSDLPTGPVKIKIISGDRMGYYSMVFYSAPTITSIAPLQASHYPNLATGTGNTILIYGTNFTAEGGNLSETTVQFGNTIADIVNIFPSFIEVTPPVGLPASCKITVTVKGMSVAGMNDFIILPSVIRHDARGTVGAAYTIEGDFLPDAELFINGIKITDFIQKTATKMYFNVPAGTTAGPVIIKQTGIGTKVFDFSL